MCLILIEILGQQRLLSKYLMETPVYMMKIMMEYLIVEMIVPQLFERFLIIDVNI